MKLYQLVLNGEVVPFTVGASDWVDAYNKMASTYDWFARLIDEKNTDPVAVYNRQNTRISFQEIS